MNHSFSIRHMAFAANVPVMALNDHIKYHDITVCLSGKMEYYIDGVSYLLTDGDCIYIAPESHRIRISNENPASYISINMDGVPDQPIPSGLFARYLTPQIMHIVDLLHTANTTHNQDKLLLLSQYLLYDLQETYYSRQENPGVLQIKRYIQQNIYSRISVEDVVRQVYLSKEYCQSLFKRQTGVSIVTFINAEKVNVAKMLLGSEHKLTTVSQMLGFEDYNYFCRVFKKYTGVSPLKYRQLLHNGD